MSRHARVYRALLRCYPADFRREFGWLMEQSFDDRLRAYRMTGARLPSVRTWSGMVRDLTVTVPVERKDHVMHRVSPTARFITLVTVFVVGLAVIFMLGSTFSSIPFLLIVIAAPFLAVRQLRNNPTRVTWRWWRVIASGVALLGGTALTFGGPWPESFRSQFPSDVMWSLGFLLVTTSFALMGVGVVLGLKTWFDRRRSIAV